MSANNQIRPNRPPLLNSNQLGNIRHPVPQMEWECPMCGDKFSQEATKDRHLTSCGYANNSNIRKPTKVPFYPGALLQNARHTSCPQILTHATHRFPYKTGLESKQRVFISIRLQQSQKEQVTYISGTGERTSLVWDSHISCFHAQAELSPGLHTGRIHINSTDTLINVKQFEVCKSPDCIPNIELYRQDSRDPSKSKPPIKPRPSSLSYEEGNKHLQVLNPEVVFGIIDKIPTKPCGVKLPTPTAYEDGEIYANVGPLAENIRLKHDLKLSQARNKELEADNLTLRNDLEKQVRVIENFKIKNEHLESDISKLKKLQNNNHTSEPAIAKQCKPPNLPPSPGPRPNRLPPAKEANK